MKISSIKTISQLYEFGEVWYQRTHNLKKVFDNEQETPIRRLKAYLLWCEMAKRVTLLFHRIIEQENRIGASIASKHWAVGSKEHDTY